jgi:DNA-directed RNA polymerase beta subunit
MVDKKKQAVKLKSVQIKSFIPLDFGEKVHIFMLRDKDLPLERIAKVFKPFVKNRIGLKVYRMQRVVGSYVVQRIAQFQSLGTMRWTPKYEWSELSRYNTVIEDISPIAFRIDAYPAIAPIWSTVLPFRTVQANRRSILMIVRDISSPVSLSIYKTLLNVYYRVVRGRLSFGFIICCFITPKNSCRWIILKTPEDEGSSIEMRSIRILMRLLKSSEKKSVVSDHEKLLQDVEDIVHKAVEEDEKEVEQQRVSQSLRLGKQEVSREVHIAGKTIKTFERKEPDEIKYGKRHEGQAVKQLSKSLLNMEDKKKIVKIASIKGSKEVLDKIHDIVKQKIAKKVSVPEISEKETKTISAQYEMIKQDVLVPESIKEDSFNYIRERSPLKTIVKTASSNFLLNNKVSTIPDHARATCEEGPDLLTSLIRHAVASVGMILEKVEKEKYTYKSLDKTQVNAGLKVTYYIKDGDITHEASFFLPSVDQHGRLLLNNRYYTLTSQLFPNPFKNSAPGVVKIFTLKNSITFESRKNYIQVRIAGATLTPPFLVCLLGAGESTFRELLKKYGIDYVIEDVDKFSKQPSNVYMFPLSKTRRIIFKNLDTPKKKRLIQDLFVATKLIHVWEKLLDYEPLSQDWWASWCNILSDNVNSAYYVRLISKVIIDPITAKLLKQKGLPSQLNELLLHVYDKLVEDPNLLTQDKIDITNFRLRTYEQIVHLAYEMFLEQLLLYVRNRDVYNFRKPFNITPWTIISRLVAGFSGLKLREYVNPVEDITSRSRLDWRGQGGIIERAVTMDQRGLHDSYRGLVDPVDTSEGELVGVTQQAANAFDVITHTGIINTEVKKLASKGQLLGPTISCIPFSRFNETTRLLISSSQLKQAIRIEDIQPPAVMSGYESVISVFTSDEFIKKSPCSGKIEKIILNEVTIRCDDNQVHTISLEPVLGRSGYGHHSYLEYSLCEDIAPSKRVSSGQIVATSPFFHEEFYQYGSNLLATFLSYKGYTYEDGIVISESTSKRMSSKHIHVYRSYLEPTDRLLNLGVSDVGSIIEPGDVLLTVDSKEFFKYLDSELFENTEVVASSTGYKVVSSCRGQVKRVSIYVTPSYEMTIIKDQKAKKFIVERKDSVVYFKNKPLQGLYIEIEIIFDLPVGLGDKFVSRHANKGVVAAILPDDEMPFSKFHKRNVDIIFSPAAVIDRAITGLVYEMYMSNISFVLGEYWLQNASKGSFDKAEPLFRHLQMWDKQSQFYKKFLDDLFINPVLQKKVTSLCKKTKGLFPLCVFPWEEPSPKEIAKVCHLLNVPINYDLEVLTSDGRKVKLNTVAGFLYVIKLEHVASLTKLKGRSIGPYNVKTGQPIAGKQGGQRLGEFETFSLISWDVPDVIKELHIDNAALKRKMYMSIIEKGSVSLKDIYTEAKYMSSKAVNFSDVILKSMLLKA